MDCEAVAEIVQTWPAPLRRATNPGPPSYIEEGLDHRFVRTRAAPLIDEKGRFRVRTMAFLVSSLEVRRECLLHIGLEHNSPRLVELRLANNQ
jgi:hypothetical protein